MLHTQVRLPEHPPPLHPENVDPPVAAAVKAATVPLSLRAALPISQLIPPGFELTVPLPAPGLFTVRRKGCTSNAAATVVAAFMVTTREPVPEQPPPLQPENVDPPAAAAVKVTTRPLL